MAEEIGFENGRNSNFVGLVTLTLTLDPAIRHTVHRRASLIDLYVHTKFHSNRRNFLWTDGRTDGHVSPLILLGRLLEVDLTRRSKESSFSIHIVSAWRLLQATTTDYTVVIIHTHTYIILMAVMHHTSDSRPAEPQDWSMGWAAGSREALMFSTCSGVVNSYDGLISHVKCKTFAVTSNNLWTDYVRLYMSEYQKFMDIRPTGL